MSEQDGYQAHTAHGPIVRTDVVDVYVFRRAGDNDPEERTRSRGAYDNDALRRSRPWVYFLQLLRSGDPLKDTWHPVMGHIEAGERASSCARRELREELGLLVPGRAESHEQGGVLLGLWALEQVHPFYIEAINTIVMSPRFAAEVGSDWTPRLNDEHSAFRWVREDEVSASFMWPGQRAACREVLELIVAGGPGEEHVRLA